MESQRNECDTLSFQTSFLKIANNCCLQSSFQGQEREKKKTFFEKVRAQDYKILPLWKSPCLGLNLFL